MMNDIRFSRRTALTAAAAGTALLSGGPRATQRAEAAPADSDIYVSRSGNDTNPGTAAAPVRSLARAAALAAARPEGTSSIWLRNGNHTLDETLLLKPHGSGRTVTWRSYPGESATVSGARRFTGWRESERDGLRVWTTAAPTQAGQTRQFRSLFVGTSSRPRPTFPKLMEPVVAGHRPIGDLPRDLPKFTSGTPVSGNVAGFHFAGNALSSSWGNQQDIDIVTFSGWFDERCPVKSISDGTGEVRFRPTPGSEPWLGRHFYADNVREALSRPGEWYLDRPAGTVTYLPKEGETVANTALRVPHLKTLIRIEGTLENPAGGHHFEGITFAHTDWDYASLKRKANGELAMGQQGGACVGAAIEVINSRDVRFDGCAFHALGGFAVDIQQDCQNIAVTRSEFSDLGGGAVRASSQLIGAANESFSTGHVTVQDCHVHHYGRVFHLSAGILIQGVHNALVEHNEVNHGFYTGISCGWSWDYANTGIQNNTVRNNHVHHVGLGLMSDLGGIYTVGRQPNTKVTGNHVHHVTGFAVPCTGIYLDQASSLIEVTGNTVHHNSEGIWAPNDSSGLIVERNVVADNSRVQVQIGGGESRFGLGGVAAYSMRIRENVIAAPGSALIQSLAREVVSDNNVLWNFDGSLSSKDGVSSVNVEIIDLGSKSIIASAAVPAVGAKSAQCIFAKLAEPVTLEPDHEYVVALQATEGGPAWHQPPLVSVERVARVVSDSFEWMPGVFVREGSPNKCFGPVNFTFRQGTESRPFVTSTSDLSKVDVRNDVSGHVGMIIRTGAQAVQVDQVGCWPLERRGNALDAWRTLGHDGQSTVADPLFGNRRSGDYALSDASPAATRSAQQQVTTQTAAGVR